jgi:hypothetical protein
MHTAQKFEILELFSIHNTWLHIAQLVLRMDASGFAYCASAASAIQFQHCLVICLQFLVISQTIQNENEIFLSRGAAAVANVAGR